MMGEAIPDGGSAARGVEDGRRGGRRARRVVGAIMAVLVVVGAGGGLWVWHARQERLLADALASCRQEYDKASRSVKEYATYLASEDVRTAGAVTVDQVTDAGTVQALAKATKPLDAKPAGCPTSDRAKAERAGTADKALASTAATRLAMLRKAVKAVDASVQAKQLADATSVLDALVAQAQQLLDSTGGQVADETTRAVLANVINQARQGASDVQDAQSKTAALQQAIDQVNASVQAKTQADREAAEAQARRAPATAPTRPRSAPVPPAAPEYHPYGLAEDFNWGVDPNAPNPCDPNRLSGVCPLG